MNYDSSWTALLQPGAGAQFFSLRPLPRFQPHETQYNPANAWWLAELSRWIYQDNAPARHAALEPAGLREIAYICDSKTDTRCALVGSTNDHPEGQFFVLVFRGTRSLLNWMTNIESILSPWTGAGKIHKGFNAALESVWPRIDACLHECESPVLYTGHSLGAALATLAAARRPPKTAYCFGSPLVGDPAFAASLIGLPLYRVVHRQDIVSVVPVSKLGFRHAGQLHYFAADGRRLIDPARTAVIENLLGPGLSAAARDLFQRIGKPASFLADHAPINYLSAIEHELQIIAGTSDASLP